MFGRLVLVRLKTAENALADGRLDEAHRLATAPDLRDHRRAQKVLLRAAELLIERARAHFDAGVYDAALADLDKARAANIRLDEINRLADDVREAARQSRQREHQDRRVVEAARQRIERGSIAAGQRILQQADTDDPQAAALREDAEHRARHAQAEFEEIRRLLKLDQIPAAIARLTRVARLHAHATELVELESAVMQRIVQAAADAIRQGRTDRAKTGLTMLGPVGRNDPRRHEVERNLELISETARAVASAQYDDGLRRIRQLRHLLPDVKWIKEAEEQIQRLCEARLALGAGPLGLLGGTTPRAAAPLAARTAPLSAEAPTAPVEPVRAAADAPLGLPSRLLMLIDGVGSYLVLFADRVSLGRLGTGADRDPELADIALLADLSQHHAEIIRAEDDYYVLGHRDIQVDNVACHRKLLFDGNRLRLGRLAQMTFRQPNPQSSTAVLALAGGSRLNHGVRDVILFSNHAVIGPGRRAHVVLPAPAPDFVLFRRGGRLFLRRQSPRPEDRFSPDHTYEVQVGQCITIGDVTFTFQPWSTTAHGSRQHA